MTVFTHLLHLDPFMLIIQECNLVYFIVISFFIVPTIKLWLLSENLFKPPMN